MPDLASSKKMGLFPGYQRAKLAYCGTCSVLSFYFLIIPWSLETKNRLLCSKRAIIKKLPQSELERFVIASCPDFIVALELAYVSEPFLMYSIKKGVDGKPAIYKHVRTMKAL